MIAKITVTQQFGKGNDNGTIEHLTQHDNEINEQYAHSVEEAVAHYQRRDDFAGAQLEEFPITDTGSTFILTTAWEDSAFGSFIADLENVTFCRRQVVIGPVSTL